MFEEIKAFSSNFFHNIIQGFYLLLECDDMGNLESFSNIIVNLIVICGGVMGILYCKQLRDKQMNATFSYLTQLKVRVKKLYNLYSYYGKEIMDRYVPENKRRHDINAKTPFMDDIIKEFAENAAETLSFLRETGEQMPASREWPIYFDLLLDFLNDAEHLSNPQFNKWASDEDIMQKEDYYKKHKENLCNIIKVVDQRQKYLTNKIFSKKFSLKKLLKK